VITEWSLQRFKSVVDHTALKFKPLTVFSGPNNSGKSTVIQAILLTTQTLQSSVSSRSVVLNGRITRLGTFDEILSNGQQTEEILVGFGLESKQPPRRPVRRTFIPPQWNSIKVKCEFSFSPSAGRGSQSEKRVQPGIKYSSIDVRTCRSDELPREDEFAVKRTASSITARARDLGIRKTREYEHFKAGLEYEIMRSAKQPTTGLQFEVTFVGAYLRHFFPIAMVGKYDLVEAQTSAIVEALTSLGDHNYRRMQPGGSVEALASLRDYSFRRLWMTQRFDVESVLLSETSKNILIEAWNEAIQAYQREPGSRPERAKQALESLTKSEPTVRTFVETCEPLGRFKVHLREQLAEFKDELHKSVKGQRPPEHTLNVIPLPDPLDDGFRFVEQFFHEQVHYLGPLRDEPKAIYPLSGTLNPKDVGFKGEFTAAVLDAHSTTKVSYIPPSEMNPGSERPPEKSTDTLKSALNQWVEYLGVANAVYTRDQGKLGHELTVESIHLKSEHDLTHVGVGVSQVLPILTLALLADPGSTLVFEQPELHLHPRVQTRLADFFLSMTLLDKQCLIETHSEHIITRLRHQAAAADSSAVSENVLIYFTQNDAGRSLYSPLQIDKYGRIDNWPQGFFDEGETISTQILELNLKKRQGRMD